MGHRGLTAVGLPGPGAALHEDSFVTTDQQATHIGQPTGLPASMGVLGEIGVPEPQAVLVLGFLLGWLGLRNRPRRLTLKDRMGCPRKSRTSDSRGSRRALS